MKKPGHNAFADKIFSIYLHYLFRRHFTAFYRFGNTPEISPDYPLLVLPNHSSWWDGFFLYYLNRSCFGRRMFLMMLEEQLQNYSFFRRLGAYGIDAKNMRSIRESLRYSSSILNADFGKNVLLAIFPQGQLLPWSTKAFQFRRGINIILREVKSTITILPLVMRIEMLAEQRPEVFFLTGTPEVYKGTEAPKSEYWQNQIQDLMRNMVEWINRGDKGSTIYHGRISVNEQVTKIARKLHLK